MTDKTTLDPLMPADAQLEIVRGLSGVHYAFYLNEEILDEIMKEESTVRGSANIPVDNQGLKEAVKREAVICIIKKEFRHPPEPTVVLKAGNGNIIGEEVFPWNRENYLKRDDVVWMFNFFVLFPKVEASGGEFFVMPPVSFPELNESNGCKDVVSCSPAPTCDKIIREAANLPVDTTLATIFVAFNRI